MVQGDTSHHAKTPSEVLKTLGVDPGQGLSNAEVAERGRTFGANRIRPSRRRSLLRIWVAQFRSVVVALLSGAALLAFVFGKHTEGIAILTVILVNCLIGFLSEWRATRSMEALRKLGGRRVRVLRGGAESESPADSLVPGDICLHEGGDIVPADLRLIEANGLRVDESPLTGESVAVPKRTDAVDEDRPLGERTGMLYRGTTITGGSAMAVVVATGMHTELGQIAEMAEEAEGDEDTPLERRLDRLGRRLAWVALGSAGIVGAAGLIAGKPALLMIETAIALGVAAIPEGLPFVATIGLARGMWLMARRQALINRLPAVETLGTTNLILSDKTGTLTENRMVAAVLVTPSGEYELREDAAQAESEGGERNASKDGWFGRALEIGVLCNNASLRNVEEDGHAGEAGGDPTEVALLAAAAQRGIQRETLLARKPEVREVAFDPNVMMMATVHETKGGFEFAVKGAPSAVIERCEDLAGEDTPARTAERKDEWEKRAGNLAGRGLRVLALADKHTEDAEAEPYRDLRFVGLIGLLDPPRQDARPSLDACRRAGIRLVMVTGDQPETARAVAASLGLIGPGDDALMTGAELEDLRSASEEKKEAIMKARVFARMSPKQKLELLTLFQEHGNRVAMTGDGVNDAPALSKADIGVAMGRRGTDAAKESSDMVLKDDAFSSILAAVEQGRVIFNNIRKSVVFMLCTNVAEVSAVGLASLLNWPLPLRPLQILFLNVVTDVFPALALSAGKGDRERVMKRPPRPAVESVLGRPQWTAVSAWSAVICACVLGSLMLAVHVLGFPTGQAVTVSFLTLAFAKLWFVFNLREPESSIMRNDIVFNLWIWAALAACVVLLLAAVYVPGLSGVLETASPGAAGWAVVLGLSAVPMLAGQVRLATRQIPSEGRTTRSAESGP